jgi:glycosyltransferase involved in cell wall biosynthesis
MKRDKILLFVPMYNCENQIPRVLEKINDTTQKILTEILVVDNGSTDNSLKAAKNSLQKLEHVKRTLVQNTQNYSLGGSHKVAFNYCIEKAYDYCIVLHGDDQADINDLVPYLESGEYRNFRSFLGSRFHRDSKLLGYSKFKTLGNKGLNLLISLCAGKYITDQGSGINMYATAYLSDKFYLNFPNDLTFNVFMLLHTIWSKSPFTYFPITWREFDQVSNAKVFKQGFRILRLIFTYVFNSKSIFNKKINQYSTIDYTYKIIYASK